MKTIASLLIGLAMLPQVPLAKAAQDGGESLELHQLFVNNKLKMNYSVRMRFPNGYASQAEPGYSELFTSTSGNVKELKCRFSRRDGATPIAHVVFPLIVPSAADYPMVGGVRFGSWEAMVIKADNDQFLVLTCKVGMTVGEANLIMQGKAILAVQADDESDD